MYAIIDNSGNNSIIDFEQRNLPLEELVHEYFRKNYIEIEDSHTLKFGDMWDEENKTWIISTPKPINETLPNTENNTIL